MKNYEEMIDNVFRRRDAYVARQKCGRRILGSALTAVTACLVGVILLNQNKTAPAVSSLQETLSSSVSATDSQPEQAPAKTESRLTLLAYTTNAVEAQMQEDITLPLAYYIGVTDIRDLHSEEAVKALMEQQTAQMDAYLLGLCGNEDIDRSDLRGICHTRTLRRDHYIISTLRCGSFQLCFDHAKDVETVNVKAVTGYGEVSVYRETIEDPTSYSRGFDITVDAEDFYPEDYNDELLIDWMYSEKLLVELENDPTTSLTNYSDTIVITVTYKDGTEQSRKIDIFINDDGSISALLHSDPVSVNVL